MSLVTVKQILDTY